MQTNTDYLHRFPLKPGLLPLNISHQYLGRRCRAYHRTPTIPLQRKPSLSRHLGQTRNIPSININTFPTDHRTGSWTIHVHLHSLRQRARCAWWILTLRMDLPQLLRRIPPPTIHLTVPSKTTQQLLQEARILITMQTDGLDFGRSVLLL